MTIALITPRRPACYGMGCPRHQDCQLYAAVEETSPDHTMATCDDGEGGRPHFQPVQEIAQEEGAC